MAFEQEPNFKDNQNFAPVESDISYYDFYWFVKGTSLLLRQHNDISLAKAYRLLNETLGEDYSRLMITNDDYQKVSDDYEQSKVLR